jgi:hypothetical protein
VGPADGINTDCRSKKPPGHSLSGAEDVRLRRLLAGLVHLENAGRVLGLGWLNFASQRQPQHDLRGICICWPILRSALAPTVQPTRIIIRRAPLDQRIKYIAIVQRHDV